MGQDEDAQPLVRRADFCRREQTRRRRVAQSPKLSQDGLEAKGDMPGDVFEKDPFGATLPDDAGNIGPEVPRVIGAAALTGRAEGLAGISGEDDVEGTAENSGIEAAQIIPDRGSGEVACALGGDEDGAGPLLPLDKSAGVETWFGEHDAQIQASAACAEGQSVPGTKHHAIHDPIRRRRRSGVTRPRSSIKPQVRLLNRSRGRYSSEFTIAA